MAEIQISKTLYELMKESVLWVAKKLEADEGFSAVRMSAHPDGKRGLIFNLESVEEALAMNQTGLGMPDSTATAYAVTYDAWLERDGQMLPILLCRAEEKGMACAQEFGVLYHFEERDGKKTLVTESGMQYRGPCECGVFGGEGEA